MNTNFKTTKFPVTLKVSSTSDMIPFEFFGEVIPISKKIQFKLGYFSSSSISTLSYGFAQFIYNGGTIDFLINHFVSENDYKLINDEFILEPDFYDSIQQDILTDIERLNDVLTKKQVSHFYNCLRYLIDHNRISIIPVTTKNGEISHYKEALFWDNEDNVINIVGSCNFTYKGIVCNGESFVINRSWGEASERANIKNEVKDYEKIFKKESKDFIYLNPEKLINIIKQKSISLDEKQLLDEELNLVELDSEAFTKEERKIKKINNALKEKFKKTVFKIVNEPRFPPPFKPREYQINAYDKWVGNDYTGVFAMATGTGKTITSLYIALEEYQKLNSYQIIILVPTQVLVNQWIKECKSFNYKNLLTSYDKDWAKKINDIIFDAELEINTNFVFIATYEIYNRAKFQSIFKNINLPNLILIADEAHNLGTRRSVSNYLKTINKKIGLSATPNRKYDEEGSVEIENYFNSKSPNHTFSYSMLKAIDNNFLTKYYYHPRFVKLNKGESEEYARLSTELLKYFDFETGQYRSGAEMLLIQRKRIIHKANSKKTLLSIIIDELKNTYDDFKHCIVYVPEGTDTDFSVTDSSLIQDEDIRIIDEYTGIISHKGIKVHQFVGDTISRDKVLKNFENGEIEVLTAMKMLDEGVDIPATKFAIFCSSTGNPRQFIQRRGRILRKFLEKEKAIVYDMIVEPNDISFWEDHPFEIRERLHNMEVNIFKSELDRVVNFLYASDNLSELFNSKNFHFKKLVELTAQYGIDIYKNINELQILDR